MEEIAKDFFDRYAAALLERESDTIAEMYAVPSLIAFPGEPLAVGDRAQTRDFFAVNWSGYEGVTEAAPQITIVAQAGHSIWADVTWTYAGQPRERYIYQLLHSDVGWQIGVLTPLDL